MPSMSPRTQQMQMASGAGVDQAAQLFEQGFSEMSYNVFLSKFPDIVQDVVTFKILETDVDHGMGVGAFVLMRNDQPLYVPVVLSDNNLKPMELVYHKALNIFLPLTKQWLEEMDKTSLSSLGKGVKTPETLYSDVDIRNIVVPPTTGRFSYAAWEPVILADVAKVFTRETLEKLASEPVMTLLQFLGAAPNTVKLSFVRCLNRTPRLFKYAANVYGIDPLTKALALRVVKVASDKTAAKQLYGGGLWIANKDTTPTELRRIFGDKAPEAYAGVRRKGYAAKDERKGHNKAIQEEMNHHWVEPRQPGLYTLFGTDGRDRPALVMPNPIDLFGATTRYGNRPAVPGHNPLVNNSYYDPSDSSYPRPNRVYPHGRPDESEFVLRRTQPEYLAIFENGDYLQTSRLVGTENAVDEVAGGPIHKQLFTDTPGTPKQGLGVFVRQRGTTVQATAPIEIESITNDTEGTRRIKARSAGGFMAPKVLITQDSHRGSLHIPKGSDVVFLPNDFVWVPLKQRLEKSDIYGSALDVSSAAVQSLAATGARKVTVKSAGAGQFSIDGGPGLDKIATLTRLAQDFILPIEAVEAVLEKAASERRTVFWVASLEKLARAQMLLDKLAWGHKKKDDDGDSKEKKEKKPPSDSGGGGGSAPGADPNADPMAGGDPSMDPNAAMAAMQPPAPPPPSPSDLAGMEMQQQIDHEMLKLQEKAQMLQALMQRTQEIAGGAPVMPTVQTQAMGAPPPSMNMATGEPMPGGMGGDPSMGGPPPMDPSMGGGIPGGMGGPPPMDPSMGGGMGGPPPMDPSMMGAGGGAPPPMDPSMMGASPDGALPMAPGAGGMDPSMGGGMGGDPSMGGQPPPPPMAMMGADGPSANGLESEVNPQFLQQAADLQSHDIFDAAAVSSLAQSPAVKEMVGQYLPNLEKALDNLGRVLLSLWMQEPTLKDEIGEQTFTDLEENLRGTFKNMGDLVLKLSQGAHAIKGQYERAGT